MTLTTINQVNVPYPSRRQRKLYSFLCSLYRPAVLTELVGDKEGSDSAFESTPAFINVKSLYEPTPEYARTDDLGLTKEDSVLVSDRWHFFSSQEINDGYLIVMTGCRVPNHPYIGRAWVTQGNSQINVSSVRRPVYAQWVFAKLSPTDIIPASS